MRRFLVHVLLSTVAITVTLAILSFVRLPSPGHPDGVPLLDLGGYAPVAPGDFGVQIDLAVGFLFALITAVLPPILAAIFGRQYIRHPISAFVFANGVIFALVAVLAGWLETPFLVPEPQILWLFFDAMVFTLVIVAIDAVFGLDRPNMSDAVEHRGIWRFIERLPVSSRNTLIENFRLWEVQDKLSRFGVEIAAGRTPLARLRRVGDRLAGESSKELEALSTPGKVRVMFQQLGPTYVKLGQMLAGRRELVGATWSDELAKLQNTVPPFPWPVASAIIESELGKPPEQLFASIDHEPLGAASLAQVHRAVLHDGRQVVVKVQRPEIQARVRADLGVMLELAEVSEEKFALARRYGVHSIIEEFASGVRDELDYSIEAYNARRLADVLAGLEGVGVPAVTASLSTKRLLVMDFVPGVKATRVDQLDPSVDREMVARHLVRGLIKQMLLEGFFHGDPHPGNVILDPATGDITFLDMGLVGELAQEQRFDLLALIWALKSSDPGMLATIVRRLCVATGPVDEEAFHTAVERIFYRSWVYGGGSLGAVITDLFDALGKQNLRMRRELVMAVKAMGQAEELIHAIDPDLPLVETVVQEAQGLLGAELRQRAAALFTGDLLTTVTRVAMEAPALGVRFIPQLLDAVAAVNARVRGDDAEQVADALRTGMGGLASRVDEQGSRLVTLVGVIGAGVVSALVAMAYLFRPGELTADELVVLAVPAGATAVLLLCLWRWRQDDAR